MEQYIDKATVMAEIEKLIDEIYAGRPFDSLSSEQQTALWYVKSIMSSINNLKVKKVDLDREIRHYRMRNPIIQHREESLYDYMTNVAKHFFELGLKAQKGE